MKTIDLNSEDWRKELLPEDREVAFMGDLKLIHSKEIMCHLLDVLDLSGVNIVIDEEEWSVGGYSHCGWRGRWGVRGVDVLKRLLECCDAVTVVLPDDVAARHLNAIKKNQYIHNVVVGENCRLFSMKDGNVYNKKGTILKYEQRELVYGTCALCGEEHIVERLYDTVDGTRICRSCAYKNDYAQCEDCGKLYVCEDLVAVYRCPKCEEEEIAKYADYYSQDDI